MQVDKMKNHFNNVVLLTTIHLYPLTDIIYNNKYELVIMYKVI